MNKALFEKVKAKCKDTGLSEKYLKAITEKMGGSIEDDSTDDAAMDEVVNLIADIAGESQSEATRWTSKSKSKLSKQTKTSEEDDEDDLDDEGAQKGSKKAQKGETPEQRELRELKEKMETLEQRESKASREAAISKAVQTHGIPAWRMKGLVIPESDDPDEYLAGIKQDLITENLLPGDPEGSKTVSDAQVDEAAESLLESITVK